MLDDAGLKKDANGVRLRIDNLPIPYDENFVRAAQLIQQMLKRVGVQVEIRNFDVGTYFAKLATDRDFDTASAFAAAFSDPQVGQVTLPSGQRKDVRKLLQLLKSAKYKIASCSVLGASM